MPVSTPKLLVYEYPTMDLCYFEWLYIGNVLSVVSAVNGLQSVVWLAVIYVLGHPASFARFDGPP